MRPTPRSATRRDRTPRGPRKPSGSRGHAFEVPQTRGRAATGGGGPGQTRRNLAHLIGEAMARGELRHADAGEAAEALFGLWQGFTNFQHALGVDEETREPELRRRVEAGVDAFLRIYASG